MTMHEFANVLNHARRYNSPQVTRLKEAPVVKYIDPHISLTTDSVFTMGFRGYGGETVIHCQNECRDLPASLHDRCMTYLRTGETMKFKCSECQNDVAQACRIEGCPLS
jgi:hypothetical protein